MNDIQIPCLSIWDEAKKAKFNIHDTTLLQRLGAQSSGIEVKDNDIIIDIEKDIQKLCPNSSSGEFLTIFGQQFSDLICTGLVKYITNDTINGSLIFELGKHCPKIIQACEPTICGGEALSTTEMNTFTIRCEDLRNSVITYMNTIINSLPPSDQYSVEYIETLREDIKNGKHCEMIQSILEKNDITSREQLVAKIMDYQAEKFNGKSYITVEHVYQMIDCVCSRLFLDCSAYDNGFIIHSDTLANINRIIATYDIETQITTVKGCDLVKDIIALGLKPIDILEEAFRGSDNALSHDELKKMILCICSSIQSFQLEPQIQTEQSSSSTDDSNIFSKWWNSFTNGNWITIVITLLVLIIITIFILLLAYLIKPRKTRSK